jgi:4-aminobutyrate aminotransferase
LKKLLDKYEIKLMVDEVQSGIGRTGKWCAIEHFDVVPDIITFAKAVGGGFPLGAMVAPAAMHTWGKGSHASTFGGNPVACRASLTMISEIEKTNLLENVIVQGNYLKTCFKEIQSTIPLIGDVRGLGLMLGIELVDPQGGPAVKQAQEFMIACWKKGVAVILAGRSTIRLCPPLIITRETATTAFEIMASILKQT